MQAARAVSGRVLWSNMLLLFTQSLIPFATAWMGENSFAGTPVLVYNLVLLLPALGYFLLVRALIAVPGQPPALAAEIGRDVKGKLSLGVYVVALLVSLFAPPVAIGLDMLVAAVWIVPDPRMERALERS
jgi:uncharacterized membrane protein